MRWLLELYLLILRSNRWNCNAAAVLSMQTRSMPASGSTFCPAPRCFKLACDRAGTLCCHILGRRAARQLVWGLTTTTWRGYQVIWNERLLKNGGQADPASSAIDGGCKLVGGLALSKVLKCITHLPLASRRCRSLAANSSSSFAAADARRSRSLRVGRSSADAARSNKGPTRCGA